MKPESTLEVIRKDLADLGVEIGQIYLYNSRGYNGYTALEIIVEHTPYIIEVKELWCSSAPMQDTENIPIEVFLNGLRDKSWTLIA